MKIDAAAVRCLAEILRETDLTEIEYELENGKIRVSRTPAPLMTAPIPSHPSPHIYPSETPQPTSPSPSPQEPSPSSKPTGEIISSPLVGTIYLSSTPGSAPFVQEGSSVKEGDTLLIIEAMKVMNPIRAPKAGTVTRILVKNAQPVEFSEPLIEIA